MFGNRRADANRSPGSTACCCSVVMVASVRSGDPCREVREQRRAEGVRVGDDRAAGRQTAAGGRRLSTSAPCAHTCSRVRRPARPAAAPRCTHPEVRGQSCCYRTGPATQSGFPRCDVAMTYSVYLACLHLDCCYTSFHSPICCSTRRGSQHPPPHTAGAPILTGLSRRARTSQASDYGITFLVFPADQLCLPFLLVRGPEGLHVRISIAI